MTAKKFNYKKALSEIEEIVHNIENEDPDVDELTTMVKRAADLIKKCKSQLRDTNEELENVIRNLEE